MLTMENARALANHVLETREVEKKDNARKWVDAVAAKEVIAKAKVGKFECLVTVPPQIEKSYAIEFIAEAGFYVNDANHRVLEISWA